MTPRFVLIDFETASQCDLKKSGAWRYAADFTTYVVCMGYWIDGAKEPGILKIDELTFSDPDKVPLRLAEAALDPRCIFIAFNAGFEKAIWRNIMVAQHGWPDIPNERWHDPQSVCAMKGIPLKLERALRVLGLGEKDVEGTNTVLTFSRVDKHGNFGGDPATRQARLERTYVYCRDKDVVQELALHRRIRSLGSAERAVWLLDQRINERGVRIDLAYVDAAQRICDDAAKPLLREFREITGGINPTQRDKFMEWLNRGGANIENLKKETIDKLLGEDDDEDDSLAGEISEPEQQIHLPFAYRRPLEIRRILGSASIKKLGSMRACVGFDGRVRGAVQYHGAGPGRWAGRLFQPQNFPRPTLQIQNGWNADGSRRSSGHDPEQLVAAILTGDAEYVRCLFGEPIEAVANGLRHAIIASERQELVVGDFATVEARIVLAIAGAVKALAVLQDPNRDVYAAMASSIYDMAEPIGKDAVKAFKAMHNEKRQIGKNTVLGCGFQMGYKKFRARYAQDQSVEFAQRCISAYREDFAPEVPDLWYALEKAATRTVWDRRPHEAYGIVYALEDGWLTCRLHNGKKLWYYDPRPVKKAMPWDKDDIRPGFEYSANKTGKWIRVTAYGGLLTENVVQATARELLVCSMFECEKQGLPLVLTVHDEDLCDAPIRVDNKKILEDIMTTPPAWAKQLKIPLGAEVWTGQRYRK